MATKELTILDIDSKIELHIQPTAYTEVPSHQLSVAFHPNTDFDTRSVKLLARSFGDLAASYAFKMGWGICPPVIAFCQTCLAQSKVIPPPLLPATH